MVVITGLIKEMFKINWNLERFDFIIKISKTTYKLKLVWPIIYCLNGSVSQNLIRVFCVNSLVTFYQRTKNLNILRRLNLYLFIEGKTFNV